MTHHLRRAFGKPGWVLETFVDGKIIGYTFFTLYAIAERAWRDIKRQTAEGNLA